MGRLILLFVSVPLVELYLLVRLGEAIGLAATILLVLATGALGAALARRQGLATWARFQSALGSGRLPSQELLEGLLILLAGAVLLTPGVLTDAMGFALLLPRCRRWIVSRLEARIEGRLVMPGGGPPQGASPASEAEAIDVEYEVLDRDR